MVNAILTFRAEPARLSEFSALMRQLKAQALAAPGCAGVRLFQGTDDPTFFSLIEEWESEDQNSAHLTRLIENGDWSRLSGMLVEEPGHRYCAEL
jgi:quinol monooxygenase YgiN